MYLKTPKRYRPGGRRRTPLISLRRLLLWLVALTLIVVGVGIYENRGMLRPYVERAVSGLADDVGQQIDQVRATMPPPTENPINDLNAANNAWTRGAMQEAINHYRQALPAMPNDLQAHYRMTMALINQGRVQEAMDAAQKTITASPFAPDAWAIQAMVYNREDASAQAISSARRALQLVPEAVAENSQNMAASRARALAFLAEAYLDAGQGELALSTIQQALDVNPDSYEALQVSGRINMEVNFDQEAALADYRAAYDLAPNLPYLGIWLARHQTNRYQNYERAIEIYQDILEQNPDNTTALFDLGDYYFRVEGNPEEANNYFSRCVEADPENAQCHWLLGRTLLNPEAASYSPQEARGHLETALELDPDNGYYMYWLAQAHMSLGQCSMALPYMENGMRIGRQNEDETLISSFEFALEEARAACGGSASVPTAIPETTPEPTPSGETAQAGGGGQ